MPEETITQTENPMEVEFSIEPYDISVRFVSASELPETLDEFGDYAGAFKNFCKLGDGKFIEFIGGKHGFMLYMRQMYQQARVEGTVRCYTYNGEDHIEFPLENKVNKVSLFASFIRNKHIAGRWFCVGIRSGGKIHDFAYFGDVSGDYNHLRNLSNLTEAGISSKYGLRKHIEEAFISAIENGQVYQYVIGGETFVEYPINLHARNDIRVTTVQFKTDKSQPKWFRPKYYLRDIKHTLDDEIRRGVCYLWRKGKRAELADEAEKQELILKEKEYKYQEALKNRIPFESFPLRKVAANPDKNYHGILDAFAYILEVPLLYKPLKNIDLRDEDVIMDALTSAFETCNTSEDIAYYSSSAGERAELELQIPGYESRKIYAQFDRNFRRDRQPWHLKALITDDIFRRTVFIPNISTTLENLQHACDAAAYGIETEEELEQYLRNRFIEAIAADEILVYGVRPRRRAELPMNMKKDDVAIHAILVPNDSAVPWKFSGFRLRYGEDPRFCISDEYKQECSIDELSSEADSSGSTAEDTEKFHGEMIPGAGGSPITLMDFCTEITATSLRFLADMAEEEVWGYSSEEPYEILYKYLNARFIRLGYEQKIGYFHSVNEPENYVAFHTGLFSRDLHEPIYACFRPTPLFSPEYTGQRWRLDGFCCRTEGGSVYERMKKKFAVLPEDLSFLKENGQYLPVTYYHMDTHESVSLKEEHVLRERGYRLPADFLRKVFRKTKDRTANEYLSQMEMMTAEEEKKMFWLSVFSPYLEQAENTYDTLLNQLSYSVSEALACNVRHPFPAYYPLQNILTWFLPLRFHEDSNLKNLVLIVRRKETGGYKGITVMNLEDIYHRARAVEKPNQDWIETDFLSQYVFSDADEDEGE